MARQQATTDSSFICTSQFGEEKQNNACRNKIAHACKKSDVSANKDPACVQHGVG